MASYISTRNTFIINALDDISVNGTWDDTSGYTSVKVWAHSTQSTGTFNILYTDTSTTTLMPANVITEPYLISPLYTHIVASLKKKRYARVYFTGSSDTSLTLTTRFLQTESHPLLNYTTDNVTAQVAINIDEPISATFSQPACFLVQTTLSFGTPSYTLLAASADHIHGIHTYNKNIETINLNIQYPAGTVRYSLPEFTYNGGHFNVEYPNSGISLNGVNLVFTAAKTDGDPPGDNVILTLTVS